MTPPPIETILQNVLDSSESLRSAVPSVIQPLAGDASARTYYRIELRRGVGKKDLSALLLLYGDAKGPRFHKSPVSQELALFQLSRFFKDHGIPVPTLYHYEPKERAFLFEDFGDMSLGDLLFGKSSDLADRIKSSHGSDWTISLMKSAISLIRSLQLLPDDKNYPVLQRALAFDNYRSEAQEFIDFFALPLGLKTSEADRLGKLFDALCEILMSIPKRLSHFDFHSYNLMMRESGEIGLIDYQDACQVSWVRDLVSLINDRGMDEKLGQNGQRELIQFFSTEVPQIGKLGNDYDMTLLHWDLRVSGRFEKLCQTKKTEKYRQWLPGMQRRLGRTLERCYRGIHGFEDLVEIVRRISPEAKEGMGDPWRIY